VVLLIWIYYSSQLFLLGAEFTRVYALQHAAAVQPAASPPLKHPARVSYS
jgi:membrane protein